MPYNYEVELKFRVGGLDDIREKLENQGAVSQDTVSHFDRYFNHPSRDFRSTDEAFRIRSVGANNCLTYKGAVLGTVAKTRHEIEVDFSGGDHVARQMIELVTLLGFRFIREVQKRRHTFELVWNSRQFEIALDDVPGLGQFIEIELIATDEDRQQAETVVWELARLLSLSDPEPRSYLDLLFASDNQLTSRDGG